MKRSLFGLMLVMISLIFPASCAKTQSTKPVKKDVPPLIVRTGVYEGLVSVDGDSVAIITNYKSRSRVDYQVTGALKEKIAALDGQVVTVVGTAKRRGWSGTIEVTEILKPKKGKSPAAPSKE